MNKIKYLTLLSLMFYSFFAEAQINLLNKRHVSKSLVEERIPTSVSHQSYYPRIISNILTIGETNKLLVAHGPDATQSTSRYIVLGGELNGECFEGATLPEDILKWISDGESVHLTLFYKNKESSEIDIISSRYVTCNIPFRYKNKVGKGYVVIRNKGKTKVFFDENNQKSFVNLYKKNILNSELFYSSINFNVLKKIQSENTTPVMCKYWGYEDTNFTSNLKCLKNQSFGVWYDSISSNFIISSPNKYDFSEDVYSRENLFKYWSEAMNTEEMELKYETNLLGMYLKHHYPYVTFYPFISGYSWRTAICLDSIAADSIRNMVAITYSDEEIDILYREHQSFSVWFDSINQIAEKIKGEYRSYTRLDDYNKSELKNKFDEASLKGDGTQLKSDVNYTFASLKETDIIILTYLKLGDEIRYDNVYFAKKTPQAKKPIITASFPYLKSFEPKQKNSSNSSWFDLLNKQADRIVIIDNKEGRKKLNSFIMTPVTFEKFGIDIDEYNNLDFIRFNQEISRKKR